MTDGGWYLLISAIRHPHPSPCLVPLPRGNGADGPDADGGGRAGAEEQRAYGG